MSDPIVTYWAGPGYDGMVPFTDAVARQMVELGINLVWTGTAAEVDLPGGMVCGSCIRIGRSCCRRIWTIRP